MLFSRDEVAFLSLESQPQVLGLFLISDSVPGLMLKACDFFQNPEKKKNKICAAYEYVILTSYIRTHRLKQSNIVVKTCNIRIVKILCQMQGGLRGELEEELSAYCLLSGSQVYVFT